MQAEQAHDVRAHLWRRRRREGRDERAARQRLDERRDLLVARPEVVTPLREAVSLVDGDHRDGLLVDDVLEVARAEALRCDVDELVASLGDGREARVGFGEGERAVDVGRGDALLGERVDLVLHQGDQRRDDERESREDQRGDLEADGFACACRHDGERIVPGEQALDHGDLSRPEIAVAVEAAEEFACLVKIRVHDGKFLS